jgi:acyl carrier protein
VPPEPRFYDRERVPVARRQAVAAALARADEGPGADSLDVVEMVMLLEEESGRTIPDEAVERFRSLGEAIDYLLCHGPERG